MDLDGKIYAIGVIVLKIILAYAPKLDVVLVIVLQLMNPSVRMGPIGRKIATGVIVQMEDRYVLRRLAMLIQYLHQPAKTDRHGNKIATTAPVAEELLYVHSRLAYPLH